MKASFLRLPEVQARTGLSRSAIFALVQKHQFPAPVKPVPGGRTSAWVDTEVSAWIEQRIATSRDENARAAA